MAKFNFFSKLFESKQEYDVELTEAGPNMIMVIQVVREVTGLGLKEAKEIVDGVPSIVKRKCQEKDAQNIKAKLEAVGAKISLK